MRMRFLDIKLSVCDLEVYSSPMYTSGVNINRLCCRYATQPFVGDSSGYGIRFESDANGEGFSPAKESANDDRKTTAEPVSN